MPGTWITDTQYNVMRLICCAVFLKVPLNIGFTTNLWQEQWPLEVRLHLSSLDSHGTVAPRQELR